MGMESRCIERFESLHRLPSCTSECCLLIEPLVVEVLGVGECRLPVYGNVLISGSDRDGLKMAYMKTLAVLTGLHKNDPYSHLLLIFSQLHLETPLTHCFLYIYRL
jgi:hypothetical protein